MPMARWLRHALCTRSRAASACAGYAAVLAAILIPLVLVLAFGIVSIVGAYAREGTLEPGKMPTHDGIFRARRAMAIAAVIVGGALLFGWSWWNSEDGIYRKYVFKPLALKAPW